MALSRRNFVRFSATAAAAVAAAGAGGSLLGCSGGSGEKSEGGGAASAEDKVLYVGGQIDYPPYSYYDKDNNFTGFDPAVARAIDDALDGYSFELDPIGWDASFIAVDSGRFQLFIDQIAITAEREKQYLFSIPYYQDQTTLVVKKGRTDIQKLDDCVGKTFVSSSPSDTYTLIVEEYNNTHGPDQQINIEYNQASVGNEVYLDLEQGRSDFYLDNPVRAVATITQNNFDLQVIGEPITSEPIAILLAKTDEGAQLKALIDPIIERLLADGTIDALAEEYLAGEWDIE